MQRRTIAVILALFAAAGSLAQGAWYFESMPPPSGAWGIIALGLTGIVLSAAIPTIGAVSLARRRETGIAVLVAAGLAVVPMIIVLPRFLTSGGSDLGLWLTWLNVVSIVALVVGLILVAAARLPRRLAACLLLASFTPRLYFSIELAASPMGMGRATTPEATFAWLAMAGEATLVGLAIWWLVTSRDHADGGRRPPRQVPAGTA